jgi:hypothetical protein
MFWGYKSKKSWNPGEENQAVETFTIKCELAGKEFDLLEVENRSNDDDKMGRNEKDQ